MPRFIVAYVRYVEAFNRAVGKFAMYLILLLLGILLYAAFSKASTDISPIWTVEMAQFTLTAYFMLGGAYALQNNALVRMDLFYSHWKPRTRAIVDCITIIGLLIYLAILLYGAVISTHYTFEIGQRRPSAWQPYLWPIRTIMSIGVLMMLLQAIATFFKDLAIARGKPIE
ncbi:TRAP transporter small permease subunit [Dongia deserti]|uniref:TRAP transporter small permease subunit n=1 Tax=Dongia deserti TaxID=2268030 RepID=UPI000E6594D2|nr:TRAP transporter small permease subunit [Dongia deserti]